MYLGNFPLKFQPYFHVLRPKSELSDIHCTLHVLHGFCTQWKDVSSQQKCAAAAASCNILNMHDTLALLLFTATIKTLHLIVLLAKENIYFFTTENAAPYVYALECYKEVSPLKVVWN